MKQRPDVKKRTLEWLGFAAAVLAAVIAFLQANDIPQENGDN
jgi:hypothetical protein